MLTDKIVYALADAREKRGLERKESIIKYGFQMVFSLIWKSLLAYMLAVLLDIGRDFLIFYSVLFVIRAFGCGVHMRNDFMCTAAGMAIYLGGTYLATKVIISLPMLAVIFAAMFIVFFKYAPAGTRQRPVGVSRIKTSKLIALSLLLVFFIVAIASGEGIVRSLITFACIAEGLLILPVTYLVLGEGRSKDYEKK